MADSLASDMVAATLPVTPEEAAAPAEGDVGPVKDNDESASPGNDHPDKKQQDKKKRPRCNKCRRYGHMTATCSKPKRKSKKTKSNTNLPKETKTDAPVKEAADASEAKADVPSAVTLSEGDFEIIKAVLASVHQRIAVKHCNTLSDTLATLKERLDRIETAVQAAQRDFGTLRNLIHCIANKAAGEVVERLQEAEAADGSLVAESENPEPASTDDPAVPTVVVTPPPATKIDGGVESEDSEVDGGLHFEA